MSETAKLGFPSIIEILGDVESSLAGSIEHAAAASLIERCVDALRIWAVNGWDDVAPQPVPADAVTEAAVRAAREWYADAKDDPYPDARGRLAIRLGAQAGFSEATEHDWAVFQPAFEAEARRLLDAGEFEVRG